MKSLLFIIGFILLGVSTCEGVPPQCSTIGVLPQTEWDIHKCYEKPCGVKELGCCGPLLIARMFSPSGHKYENCSANNALYLPRYKKCLQDGKPEAFCAGWNGIGCIGEIYDNIPCQ